MRTVVAAVVIASSVLFGPLYATDEGSGVTIIEIPEPTTPPETLPPETAPPTTVQPTPTTVPDVVPTTVPDRAETPAPADAEPVAPADTEPGAETDPSWLVVALVAAGAVVAAVLLVRVLGTALAARKKRKPEPVAAGAVADSNGSNFEVLQYTSLGRGGGVVNEELGLFGDLEEAIDFARSARLTTTEQRPAADLWWVVREPGSIRAMWIAESGTDEERMIDLTAYRKSPSKGTTGR